MWQRDDGCEQGHTLSVTHSQPPCHTPPAPDRSPTCSRLFFKWLVMREEECWKKSAAAVHSSWYRVTSWLTCARERKGTTASHP